jgi:hypothetical protein
MAATFISDLITRGLESRRERLCLAACAALCSLYLGLFAWVQINGKRIDTVFFARRQEVLFQHLLQARLRPEAPVGLTEKGQVSPAFLLLDGWSVPESWGVWSDGAHADLAFALPTPPPAQPVLVMWATIIPNASGTQDIRVTAWGRPAGRWQLGGGRVALCVALPAGAANQSGIVRIGVDVGSPQVPPGGLDHRALGVGLERVELLSQSDACPADAKQPSPP